MAGKVYQNVGSARPMYSVFNLSHTKQYNCDFFQLVPTCFIECIPGDRHTIKVEDVIRMNPMIVPPLHRITFKTDFFFVPTRILYHQQQDFQNYIDSVDPGQPIDLDEVFDFEKFITGGEDGDYDTPIPLWPLEQISLPSPGVSYTGFTKYSLGDYFGMPVGVNLSSSGIIDTALRCYNRVWNDYYRAEHIVEPVDITVENGVNGLLSRAWMKDRFTVALPDVQLGSPPALPLDNLVTFNGPTSSAIGTFTFPAFYNPPVPGAPSSYSTSFVGAASYSSPNVTLLGTSGTPSAYASSILNWLNTNSQVAGFTVTDLRYAFAVQKFQERNMRSGVRYTEFLQSQFDVYPQDARLQRPEYIGGTTGNVIISEVLQTSGAFADGNSITPQGNLAGHGIMASGGFIGKYHVKEHGYIIGLSSVQPVPVYNQGVHKIFTRKTKWDFPNPLFVNLSEVAIQNKELFVTGNATIDDGTFGYIGIYDEMRIQESMVVADMRDTLSMWNLARSFDTTPSLSESFIYGDPHADNLDRIFAVLDEPGFIINHGNDIRSVRPLPSIAEPGLIDHH